ncbi:MAG: excinuclease ABC subunit UvrB [Candidatus Lokiarchaeota archaeon]|nr:excinuclease ABC subunit UvrB [Candidatus Lokiarchaeota archaeon]
MEMFELVSDYEPKGDQPKAIKKIVNALNNGRRYATLLGVTGSGKTFSMANIIERIEPNIPVLVISHNKTLAAQLYREFKDFFPDNAVEYFVSYYSYYRPEAYVPSRDLYIDKDVSIDDDISKLRLSTINSLMTRRDVIVVASVSCIYGLGRPDDFKKMVLIVKKGQIIGRDEILERLVELQYERTNVDLENGKFRVRGDTIDVFPGWGEIAVRIEIFGDEVDRIAFLNPVTGKTTEELESFVFFPTVEFIMPQERIERALDQIKKDMKKRIEYFVSREKMVEAQRLEFRTRNDLTMLEEVGYVSGIENYTRYLSGTGPGEPPSTLLDYFPDDFLIFIDESHVTIPQINGMYRGNYSRKKHLIDYGFRLPSAYDNRPLKFKEFEERARRIVFVSATPADYEINKSNDFVVEQLIRPTGLLDPKIEVRPCSNQVEDLLKEIRMRVDLDERILVTTLTKRMAEQLTDYYVEKGINARYLHSEIPTLERLELIRDLRLGSKRNGFDVLIGINLLREGLDLPEVSLVAILDADKEGFLRSEIPLIQTIGRVSRNVKGTAILYGDNITKSMERAISETRRRRRIQKEYNKKMGIKPKSIIKSIQDIIKIEKEPIFEDVKVEVDKENIYDVISRLEINMRKYADNLEFEKAAVYRDRIRELKDKYKIM